jgi:hypothetical protein
MSLLSCRFASSRRIWCPRLEERRYPAAPASRKSVKAMRTRIRARRKRPLQERRNVAEGVYESLDPGRIENPQLHPDEP